MLVIVICVEHENACVGRYSCSIHNFECITKFVCSTVPYIHHAWLVHHQHDHDDEVFVKIAISVSAMI
jgi:hypothetical protein